MGIRLIGKAFVLATRSRKRFLMFTVVYAILIAWTAWSVDAAYKDWTSPVPVFGLTTAFMLISIVASIMISMFYANIIVNYRRIEIATFKCIGWKNDHVRTLIVGEIMSVTLIAFVIVIEFLFHLIAILGYVFSIDRNALINPYNQLIPIGLLPAVITFGIILGVQVFGILIANTRILKVRPIQALQMRV